LERTIPRYLLFNVGKEGAATVVLEAIATHDLWIWHAFFGLPGTLNDINIIDRYFKIN
jgi:hypothetical protein